MCSTSFIAKFLSITKAQLIHFVGVPANHSKVAKFSCFPCSKLILFVWAMSATVDPAPVVKTETPLFYNCNYPATLLNLDTYQNVKSRSKWNESPEARQRRLARNAERMREKRSKESEEEYRARLARNAEANRIRRQNESDMERTLRLMKNAARQRLRRANESGEDRAKRLAKSAERMRMVRASAPKVEKPNLADRLKGY